MEPESPLAARAVSLGHDLEKLGALDDLASSARIIMLGEQNHGDGASFVFKAKLIEYLHKQHGYNVLAFEADFYALEKAWQRVRTPQDIAEHVKPQIYSFWTNTAESAPLWNLVEAQHASDTPLVVAGIDARHSGRDSVPWLLSDIEALLEAEAIPGSTEFSSLLETMLKLEYQHKVNALEQDSFFTVLSELYGRSEGFRAAMLRNLGYCARNAWSFRGRDEGMAANLLYLARERFPKEKIIVWAHNYHIAKKSSILVEGDFRAVGGYSETLLGEGAAPTLAGVISLALLSAEGWYHDQGNFERQEKFTAPEGTLEGELAARGFDYAFLDLQTTSQPFSMSTVFHNAPADKPWAEAFDGVLFLREMTGLTF